MDLGRDGDGGGVCSYVVEDGDNEDQEWAVDEKGEEAAEAGVAAAAAAAEYRYDKSLAMCVYYPACSPSR